MEINFTINGKLYKVSPATVPIDTTLNVFIRQYAGLRGTKFMCMEGGCGACIVTVREIHPGTKKPNSYAINSCLQNVYSCHGLEITTVEGLGNKKEGMHKIQSRLANFNGTQCGFCSPGMVMSMYSLMESKDGKVTMKDIENSLDGNICRCTGYRPILDAFKSLAIDADPALIQECKDIEELIGTKTCPKTGSVCTGSCSTKQPKNLLRLAFPSGIEWFKVYKAKEIFGVLNLINDKPYMLVAGNTAHIIQKRSEDLKVFIDVTSVEELRSFTIDKQLEIGGGMGVTEAVKVFESAIASNENFKYLSEFVKHFELIGNKTIRNSGTIAGNLMLKHAINGFPSDIFLLFEAVGAIIVVKDDLAEQEISMKDFLNTNMTKKIILKIILPQLVNENMQFASYKIMPRAQNVASYINAAFLLKTNSNGIVYSATVCYGGINPKTLHIEKLEKFLVGKRLSENETLQGAVNILNEELVAEPFPTGASPEYRKKLAISIFYKFALKMTPPENINAAYLSGADILTRELSSGQREFETNKKDWPLTKNVPKVEADIQCTGEAQYINDMPKFENELYGAFVLSTIAQGTILKIDPTPALNVPGVVKFIRAEDIPGVNNFMSIRKSFGFNFGKEEVLCSGKVLHHGQPIGIIVAETFDLAYYAANLVKVDYEVSKDPIYPTAKDVYKANAKDRLFDATDYFVQATEYGKDTKKKFSGHFEIPSTQYHYHLETQQCISVPTEDGMDVYSSTQWMDNVQVAISEMLKMPANSINMFVRRLGGGFGGKISRPSFIGCASALACYVTKRPIRFILTLDANMKAVGKRFSTISDYEVEVDENGKIQRLKNHYIQDLGCNLNEPVQFNTTPFSKNCYDTRSWDIIAQSALTNSASNTWMRAPGTTDAIAMTESIMEHIAKEIKKDPIEVRIANLPEDSVFHKMLPMFEQDIDFRKRKAEIDDFNSKNRWVKRGIAVVPMKYYIFYVGAMHCIVSIYQCDGTVSICHGGVEMGQGLNTKVVQVASMVMGLPMENFSIKPSNSLISPNDVGSVASVTSEIACFIVKKACEILMERLEPFREKNKNATWEEIVELAFMENVDLSANYMYKAQEMEAYYVYGTSCAEVEIDILTGNLILKRVDILEDTGESMSPGIDIGQIEGGFIMGLGIWLTENLIYDQNTGELLTSRAWNYKPPSPKDIPVDFRIKLLQKTPNPYFVLRSKATGEPPVTMACVISFAIRYAIDAARKDAGLKDEWYPLEPPLSPEKIFLAANTNLADLKIS